MRSSICTIFGMALCILSGSSKEFLLALLRGNVPDENAESHKEYE